MLLGLRKPGLCDHATPVFQGVRVCCEEGVWFKREREREKAYALTIGNLGNPAFGCSDPVEKTLCLLPERGTVDDESM
jgi:hypothetical protein